MLNFNRIQLLVTRQPPLSMGFSRQEYWSELPCPPSGDLPNPGIEHLSLKSPALAGGLFTTSATWEAQKYSNISLMFIDLFWFNFTKASKP